MKIPNFKFIPSEGFFGGISYFKRTPLISVLTLFLPVIDTSTVKFMIKHVSQIAVFIYEYPHQSLQIKFWKQIAQLPSIDIDPWLIIADFN